MRQAEVQDMNCSLELSTENKKGHKNRKEE